MQSKFTSPDKSILDDEVDDDDSSTSSFPNDREEFPNTSDIRLSFNNNIANECQKLHDISKESSRVAELRKEIVLLKAQVEESRKTLSTDREEVDKAGHSNLTNENRPIEETSTGDVSGKNNTVTVDVRGSITQDALKEELEKYVESIREEDMAKIQLLTEQNENLNKTKKEHNEDNKMVHVSMLDSENFMTDWNTLGPLPPPPEHNLHSPIVSALLEQWTSDISAQDSIVKWIEKVMNGENPDSIEPLKIPGLNHQVRDGFTMHVLPILLRRPDIHVEVTSRAHRHTSYDIAVSINSLKLAKHGSLTNVEDEDIINHSNALNSSSPHMMAFKASGASNKTISSRDIMTTKTTKDCDTDDSNHRLREKVQYDANETNSVSYSASTTPISNHVKGNSLNLFSSSLDDTRNNEADSSESNGEPYSGNKNSQSSIVAGALNAVGGLLNRRKPQEVENQRRNEGWSFRNRSTISSPPNGEKTDLSSSSCSIEEEEQPYHRVVSAPPGKIGITFVQYRGHAMISDVYQDSPLIGWVFPSDILIAIDEVPVSGMRVPEIVRLLTARKERQRALRLISSHAMTELLITQESGALMDG